MVKSFIIIALFYFVFICKTLDNRDCILPTDEVTVGREMTLSPVSPNTSYRSSVTLEVSSPTDQNLAEKEIAYNGHREKYEHRSTSAGNFRGENFIFLDVVFICLHIMRLQKGRRHTDLTLDKPTMAHCKHTSAVADSQLDYTYF